MAKAAYWADTDAEERKRGERRDKVTEVSRNNGKE